MPGRLPCLIRQADILAGQFYQQIARLDPVARANVDGCHSSVDGILDGGLHLHRFCGEKGVPFFTLSLWRTCTFTTLPGMEAANFRRLE